MDVIIRKANTYDIPLLLRMNLSSFDANKEFDPYIDMNWIHSEDAKKHFTDAVSKSGHYAIVAEIDNKPVGFLFLSPKQYTYRKVKMIELDILAVLPEYRSQGVGKMLIDHAKRWAKENGFQAIYVSSYIKNERAVAFYKKQGFSPIDISLEYVLD